MLCIICCNTKYTTRKYTCQYFFEIKNRNIEEIKKLIQTGETICMSVERGGVNENEL